MKASTSPSIGVLSSTNQFVVAFQANTGKFAVYSQATGTSTVTTTSMTAGTSPSLVALLNGSSYEAAFLSSSNEIWTYESANGGRSIPRTQAVATGTSLNIANVPGEAARLPSRRTPTTWASTPATAAAGRSRPRR